MLYSVFHIKQCSESSKTSVLAPDTCEDCPLSGRAILSVTHTQATRTPVWKRGLFYIVAYKNAL